MVKNPEIANIHIFGEALCLNFINTVHGWKETPPRDYLFHTADIIAWGETLDVISAAKAKSLTNIALSDEKDANKFFKETIKLRELLHAIFRDVCLQKEISERYLNALNKIFSTHFSYLTLKQEQPLFKVEYMHPHNPYYPIIAPVITDAYHLLTSNTLHRIKECPSCGWLFLDTTKNGKRRWCNMKTCGSTIKALNWYYRQKQKDNGC